jgi:tetratricopeptide (TPR) repeat protein
MNAAEDADFHAAAISAARASDPDGLDELGKRAAESGDLEGAVALFRAAVAAGGGWAGYNLGTVLKQLHRYEAAAEAFRYAADAGITDARVSLGNLLSDHLGRQSEAEREYRVAVEAGDLDALVNLGLLHLEMGRQSDAMDELSQQPARR